MKTILIANTKGGCAKTTTAMYLATALVHSSPGLKGVVIDGDPQGTATEWALRAEEDGEPLPFDVDSANRSNLQRKISSYDWAVIDTEPGEGKGFTDAALALADVAIIPTRTTAADMERMWATEKVASQHGEAIVLITQSPTSNTVDRREAFSALDSQGVSYFETFIPFRTDIGRAVGTVPGPKMHNYDEVLAELKEAMQW
ncbi:AAA family ATPase [Shigella flexneri]|nr:AAA family ATPase [Shigella flexneri]